MDHKVVLVIPAYNEQANIGNVLRKIQEINTDHWLDVVVIDDGSSDNTYGEALACKVTVIRQVYNMGYGAALQTGYKYAVEHGYEYLLQMDADGQHDVRNLERIYRKLTASQERQPDIVIGSRFLSASQTYPVSKIRLIAIRMFRFVIRRLTGYTLTDPTSGLQGLNRRAFSCYASYSNFDIKYPDLNMILQMLLHFNAFIRYKKKVREICGQKKISDEKPTEKIYLCIYCSHPLSFAVCVSAAG